MSPKRHDARARVGRASTARPPRHPAPVFAALGDPTRLALVQRLSDGQRSSIRRLSEDSPLTRQAITKHLRVLEDAGIVRATRHGREMLFTLEPEPIDHARQALDLIARQWADALARLKAFVERA